jgi:TctA family transporter
VPKLKITQQMIGWALIAAVLIGVSTRTVLDVGVEKFLVALLAVAKPMLVMGILLVACCSQAATNENVRLAGTEVQTENPCYPFPQVETIRGF